MNFEKEGSVFSQMTYTWVTRLFRSKAQSLEPHDMFALPDSYDAEAGKDILTNLSGNTSIFSVILNAFKTKIFLQCLLMASATVAGIGSSLTLDRFIASLENRGGNSSALWVLLLTILLMTSTLLEQQSLHVGLKLCVPLRSAVLFGVIRKSLRIPLDQMQSVVGRVHNLVHQDSMMIAAVLADTAIYVVTPLRALAIMGTLFYLLGWSSLVGVALLALTVFLSGRLSKNLGRASSNRAKASDNRVTKTSQALSLIEQIQVDNHLSLAQKTIDDARHQEIAAIKQVAHRNAWLSIVAMSSTVAVPAATFLFHVALGQPLNTGAALASISLFAMLRAPLMSLPGLLSRAWEAKISGQRIQQYLSETESQKADLQVNTPAGIVTLGNIMLYPGESVAVTGAPGSGKSTFLEKLCGLKPSSEGRKISGKVTWMGQNPWLFHATVLENILLNQKYDKDKLQRVLEACALDRDLEMWPEGLNHPVGPGGNKVSGGQRQRIALARCLYSESDILLLDSPVSALDPLVAEIVMNRAILSSRATRIVVVQDVHALKYFDRILEVANDGIKEISADRVKENPPSQSVPFPTQEREVGMKVSVRARPLNGTGNRKRGQISWETVKAAFPHLGGRRSIILLLIFIFASECARAGLDYLVSSWSRTQNSSPATFLTHYSLTAFLTVALMALVWLWTARTSVLFGQRSHDEAIQRIIRAPVSYHHSAGKGQILNRLSIDLRDLETNLLVGVTNFSAAFFSLMIMICIATIIQPVVLIVVVFVCALFYSVQKNYRAYSREIKRINAGLRTPVYGLIDDLLNGMAVVRMSSAESFLEKSILQRFSDEQRSFYTLMSLNRWLAVRLEFLAVLILSGLALLPNLLSQNLEPSLLALAITYTFMSSALFNNLIRQGANLEQFITSVERIQEYWDIPHVQQTSVETLAEPAPIQLYNVSLAYEEGKEVLSDVNFQIPQGMKLGICGRTGSGKTSLLKLILGVYFPNKGEIRVGSQTLHQSVIHAWRQNLSAVRQSQEFAFGSLRHHLSGPENEVLCTLKEFGLWQSFNRQNVNLDSSVAEWDLSPGEKQLLALAKAKNSSRWCQIFDEVTSSLDAHGKKLFYQILDKKNPSQTIIVVSHDLQTLSRMDHVVVMDNGKIVEQGHPEALILESKSEFRSLFHAPQALKLR